MKIFQLFLKNLNRFFEKVKKEFLAPRKPWQAMPGNGKILFPQNISATKKEKYRPLSCPVFRTENKSILLSGMCRFTLMSKMQKSSNNFGNNN